MGLYILTSQAMLVSLGALTFLSAAGRAGCVVKMKEEVKEKLGLEPRLGHSTQCSGACKSYAYEVAVVLSSPTCREGTPASKDFFPSLDFAVRVSFFCLNRWLPPTLFKCRYSEKNEH